MAGLGHHYLLQFFVRVSDHSRNVWQQLGGTTWPPDAQVVARCTPVVSRAPLDKQVGGHRGPTGAIRDQQGPSMAVSDHICPPINHRPNTFSLVEYKKQWRKSKRKPPTPVKQHFVLNVPRFWHQNFIECFIPESLEKQLKDILEVFLFLVFKDSYQISLLD